MRILIDAKSPLRRETLTPAQVRQRICDRLTLLSEDEFRLFCDDNGISPAAFFDRNQHQLKRQTDGNYELITFHPAV